MLTQTFIIVVIIIWKGIQYHYMYIIVRQITNSRLTTLHKTADDVAGLRRLYAATRTWLEELNIDIWMSDN